MLVFEILPKILYKPREAFESLRGQVDKKDGIYMWLFLTFLSLLIFAGVARNTGYFFMPISFGFEEISAYGIFYGFLKGVIVLLLMAYLTNAVAVKLGGLGHVSETIGVFGYAAILSIPKAVLSTIILGIIYMKAMWAGSTIALGGTVEVSQIFGSLQTLVLVISIIVMIWFYWITGTGLSVMHNLSLFRSVVSVLASVLILFVIFEIVRFLSGFQIGVF